jgi:hypothetical protein
VLIVIENSTGALRKIARRERLVGSNPTPATKYLNRFQLIGPRERSGRFFLFIPGNLCDIRCIR